jgi:hypothetical protein
MPLTVNVGLSRKSSENYQSQGLSINITAELDQSLLADPPRLQTEIDRIYAQAEDALERQASAGKQPSQQQAPARHAAQPANGNGRAPYSNNGHGHANSNGTSQRPPVQHSQGQRNGGNNGAHYGGAIRPATESQMRALRSLAKRLTRDLDAVASEAFGIASAQLDLQQASTLIDQLKEWQDQGRNARERSRA